MRNEGDKLEEVRGGDRAAVVAWPVAFVFSQAGVMGGELPGVATQLRHGDVVQVGETREAAGLPGAGVVWCAVSGGALGGVDVGWVESAALAEPGAGFSEKLSEAEGGVGLVVTSLVGQVFAVGSRKGGPALVELPGESRVLGLERVEGDAASPLDRNVWWRVRLADGREGWIQGGDVCEGAMPVLRDGAARVAEAERLLGRPYVWGGCSTFGLDCSGLTMMLARQSPLRLRLPHSAKRQMLEDWPGLARVGEDRAVEHVGQAQRGEEKQPGSTGWQLADEAQARWAALLEPGDFVYFAMSPAGGGGVDHVGVYAGGGVLIHASSSGEPCTKREAMWGVGEKTSGGGGGGVLAMRMVGVRRLG